MINDRIELNVENHVAHVRLARPQKMNAIDSKMFEAIPLAGDQLRQRTDVRAIVISGDGGNFCAGLDKSNFSEMLAQSSSGTGSSQTLGGLQKRTQGIANDVQYVAWLWRELPVPVIAAIEGVAFGGGLQIALGADFRYAAPTSRFSIMELKWGLIPDMSSTQIMRHMIRDDVIRELTYTAKVFDAQQAKEWGFVTNMVDDPLVHAMQAAQEIASKNPHAIRAAKRVIDASYYQTAAEGLLMESLEQDKIIGSPNQVEAVMAELEARAPEFVD